MQIDLVDMRSKLGDDKGLVYDTDDVVFTKTETKQPAGAPDNTVAPFRYIVGVTDIFSKYQFLYPLRSKKGTVYCRNCKHCLLAASSY